MARRRYSDQLVSAPAKWAGRLAVFALVVAALAVVIVRSNLLEMVPAMVTFGAALTFAAIAILLAVISFVGIWRDGRSGLGSSLLALLIGGGLIAYPAYLGYRAWRTPSLTDITTNPSDPPRFDVIARLRDKGANDYPAAAAQRQRALYPDLEPVQVSAPPQIAYDAALSIATKRKWRVVDARAPIAGRRDGVIEAVARSPIMGFRDDVVIRVRAAQGNTARVDIRSSSRLAFHDFGENVARVRALIEEIDDTATAAAEKVQPAPAAQKPAQPAAKRPNAKR